MRINEKRQIYQNKTYLCGSLPDQVCEVADFLVGLTGRVVVVILSAINGTLFVPALHASNFWPVRLAGSIIQRSCFVPLKSFKHKWKVIIIYAAYIVGDRANFAILKGGFIGFVLETIVPLHWVCSVFGPIVVDPIKYCGMVPHLTKHNAREGEEAEQDDDLWSHLRSYGS